MKRLDAALAGFDAAMKVADKHRRELKTRYGFTDKQIGLAVLARRKSGPYRRLAMATLRAKTRMDDAAKDLSSEL
jgi:hypothetical protein